MIALTDIDIDIYIYEYQIPNQFDRNVFETRYEQLNPISSGSTCFWNIQPATFSEDHSGSCLWKAASHRCAHRLLHPLRESCRSGPGFQGCAVTSLQKFREKPNRSTAFPQIITNPCFFDSSIDATFFKLKVAFWDDSWPKMILQTTKSTVGVI